MKKISNYIVEKRNIVFIITFLILILSIYGIFRVNINYDMSSYLPNDSEVKKGMEVMTEEFGDMSSITVMFDDLNTEQQTARKKELEQIENVKSVTYLQDDKTYQKDNHSKYLITVSANTYSNEASKVLDEIKTKYGSSAYVSGAIVDNDMMVTTLMEEIPVIAVIAVIIIFIILVILCDTWIEPLLYMSCIGIAILINMGTNAILPSVSFMTFAIGALLQMGLSMDYSIMLMNRYNQEKQKNSNPSEAMKEALANSFSAISSSSVTTIVGLLSLVFMSFKIGQDMGIVLAKGVFISLIYILTVLPGLVVKFDKIMTKTHKKSLNFNTDPIMKFVQKTRFIILPLILIIVVASYFMKDELGIMFVKTFDNSEQEYIEKVFGVDNQIALLYKNDENASSIESVIKWLEEQDKINYVQDFSNTIGKKYNYKELASEMDINIEQAKMMYQMYKDKDNGNDYEKITMYDLIVFLDENIVSNPAYADVISEEQKTQIKDARKELEEGKIKIADAEKEISNGEREIITNEKKLKDGEKELASAPKQLEDAEKQIKESEQQLISSEQQIIEGEKQIKESEAQLTAGEQQLLSAEKQLKESEQQIIEGEKQIAVAGSQLVETEKQLTAGEQQILNAEKQLEETKQQMIASGKTEEEVEAELANQKSQIEAQKTEIGKGKQQLESGKVELNKKKEELQNAREQLKKGKAELASKMKKLQTGKQQLEAGKAELVSGRSQIENGKTQLQEGKKQLEKGKKDYEIGKKQIADGKKQLEEGKKKIIEGKQQLKDGKKVYETPMTAEELSKKMDMNIQDVNNMLKIVRMSKFNVENEIMLEEFLNFVYSDILTNETYNKAIKDDMKKEIQDAKVQIDENKSMMLAENYNRMAISINLPSEGDETFEFIGNMKEKISNTLEKENYLVGDSIMGYEMNEGFTDELNFVTLLTIIAILVVVLFTLHSIPSSVMLVAVIQGAVYITTAISVLQGETVNYIALILVQCILMGSTIDYGILLICNYTEERKTKDKHNAICMAMRNSIKTILTSSLILFSCCLSVGIIMTQKVISQTCSTIACGTVSSVIMVILVLPVITLILDRFIIKNK